MALFSIGIGLDLLVSGTWLVVIVRLIKLSALTRRSSMFASPFFWLGMMAFATVTLRWTDWLDWQGAGILFNPVEFGLLFVSVKASERLLATRTLSLEEPSPFVGSEAVGILTDREGWFEILCNSAPVGFFFYHESPDLEHYPLFVNRYWQELTGYEPEAFRQAPWDWMVHPDDRLAVRKDWERSMHANQPFRREFRWVGKNGHSIWVHCGAVPMLSLRTQEQVLGYAGIMRDITKERQQQEDLLKLHQQQEELLNIVSHELRAPLTNIRLAVKMITLQPTAANIAKYLAIVQAECDRELELVNNLLDYQSLSAGRTALQPDWFALLESVQSVLDPFLPRLAEAGITLQLQVDPSLHGAYLFLIQSNLIRILSELLNNACKYTPRQETITIVLEYAADTLQIAVSNSGMTLPPEVLPKLFDRFYRVPGVSAKTVGTGLGLTVVAALCLEMRGSIKAESDHNQVCFRLQLPTRISYLPHPQSPASND